MEYIHIAKFCTDEKITDIIPTVRANTNTYKFLTFIRKGADGANVSENIYFSKATAPQFETGDVIANETLKKFSVVQYTTDAGESRTKLTLGASTWVSVKDLFS